MEKLLKTVGVIATLLIASCSIPIHTKPAQTPMQIARTFLATYGTSEIGRIAEHTTAAFRGGRPKEVWVLKTWELLRQLHYRHPSGQIVKEMIDKDRAVVIVDSRIETAVGITNQREVYLLIRTPKGWKLDDLIVDEEKPAAEKLTL